MEMLGGKEERVVFCLENKEKMGQEIRQRKRKEIQDNKGS